MKRKYLKKNVALFLLFFVLIIITSCTKIIHKRVYPTLDDGRYDSEFPYNNASEQLADISNSVKMLNYIAYYKAYLFTEEQNLSFSDIKRNNIKNISIDEVYFNESVSGTATIIYYDNILVGLLTCAHIGNFPDTSVIYYNPESERKIIKQISIKVRDHYFINEIPGEGDFEVVVSDNKRDLAVLIKKSINDPFQRIKPFRYPFGESGKLELGNFVYIIGYPMGHKMITRGIISNTRDDKSDSFLIDALFNRGFSGGIILAIKDGVPNFELVGLAKSVSAKNEYLLTPNASIGKDDFNSNLPYDGDLYVKRYEGINYGITYTISTKEILEFLIENESILQQNGINIKNLIQR
jgi:hypothetical protein